MVKAYSSEVSLSCATVGFIIRLVGGSMLSAFYQFVVEQEALDNGIWLDITVRGHFTILGHTIYYNLPPYIWSIAGYGKQ